LIFDVDGTLVNNALLIVNLFQELSWKYRGTKLSKEDVVKMFGPPEEDIIARLLPNVKQEATEYLLKEYKRRHPTKGYFTLQDMNSLKRKGYSLALFTGKGRQTLEITLKKMEMIDCFDFVVCGSDISRSKPFPDGLELIINATKSKREECLLVGDSPLDVIAARRARIPGAGALWGSIEKETLWAAEPDYFFEKPSEFLQWLDSKEHRQ